MYSYVFVIVSFHSMLLSAQQVPAAATASKVKIIHVSGVALTFSQSSVYDLQQGEKSTLDIKSSFRNSTTFSTSFLSLRSSIRALLGMQNEKNEAFQESTLRATDNELFSETILTIPLGWQVDPYISVNLKTQITESHRLQQQKLLRSSKFWDPVTSQQAMGLTYSVNGKAGCFSLRSGANFQQIRAEDHTDLTDNPQTPLRKEQYKATAGMECVLESTIKLDSLITMRVRAGALKNILTNDAWNAQSESELSVKVWKAIGVVLNFVANYNEQQTKRVQIRQSLQLGFLVDL